MAEDQTLIKLTQSLLECIMRSDWENYSKLCDPTISCFEPEAVGNLVEGMEFHKFYFDLPRPSGVVLQTTMVRPHVRILGDTALVCYIRLTQVTSSEGVQTKAAEETRIWNKQHGEWKHVHFHRSPC